MRCAHLGLVALVATAGCRLGPEPIMPAAALHPRGAEVTLDTVGGELVGELLALRSGVMVIRTESPERLLAVSFSVISEGSAEPIGHFRPRDLRGTTLQTLRLTSRYPQGIDAGLESALLREYGLSRLEVLAE